MRPSLPADVRVTYNLSRALGLKWAGLGQRKGVQGREAKVGGEKRGGRERKICEELDVSVRQERKGGDLIKPDLFCVKIMQNV